MKNKVIVKEGYIEIVLEGKHGRGKKALVDSDDYIRLELHKYRWLLTKTGYVVARDKENKKNIRLHRIVLGLSDDDSLWGDHIERKGASYLDHRKSNLRIVTPVQNTRNRKPNKGHEYGYKGVSFHKKSGKIRAQLRLKDGHKFHIALFETDKAVEAAYCVDVACRIEHGEHAYLNNVDDLIGEERKQEIKELVYIKLEKHYGKEKVLAKPAHASDFLLNPSVNISLQNK